MKPAAKLGGAEGAHPTSGNENPDAPKDSAASFRGLQSRPDQPETGCCDHPHGGSPGRPPSSAAWTPPPTERIIRVPKGQPIPEGYRFKQLLGQESDLAHGSSANYTADVMLVEEVESDATA